MSRVIHILGSGPSMNLELAYSLRKEETITLNSTAYLALEAGVEGILLFSDASWGLRHKEVIEQWSGQVITSARFAHQKMPSLVKLIDVVESSEFPTPPFVRKGRSTGHLAVSLAVSLGASRAVLHGYDMQMVAGRSHHHNDYREIGYPGIYNEFINKFSGWYQAGKRLGVEIVNATPGSALKEFPLVEAW